MLWTFTRLHSKNGENWITPFVNSSKINWQSVCKILTYRLLKSEKNRYKIKLRGVGYRLVYEVRENELIILVIAVGKRERSEVYRLADSRKS
jgi:mRNA-degrading endonuclease RelE of RelBE toxin-antitoxin system